MAATRGLSRVRRATGISLFKHGPCGDRSRPAHLAQGAATVPEVTSVDYIPPVMRPRDLLWAEIEDIYTAILRHPFVTGLTDGSLPHEAFRHYIVQDAQNLRGYARALALCGAKAARPHDIVMFAAHAGGAVAAVLPCYWIYARVGEELLGAGSPDPLYARWIAMYGSEEFQAVVDAVLELTDRLGATVSPAEWALMREHVIVTSRYEWMFWDAGWRRETWPV